MFLLMEEIQLFTFLYSMKKINEGIIFYFKTEIMFMINHN